MVESELFQITKDYIEQKPVCREALVELPPPVGLSLLIDGRIEAHCYFDGEDVVFAPGLAKKADLLLNIHAEAIRRLAKDTGESLAHTGIEMAREVLLGNIQLKWNSPAQNFVTHGYHRILLKSGNELLEFLIANGMARVSVLAHLLNQLRRRNK